MRISYPEFYNVPIQKHWKQASIESKQNVIKRCLIQEVPVKLAAKEIGYTPSLIYEWLREYRQKAVMIDALKNKYPLPSLLIIVGRNGFRS
ncbi:helix-turn-helix domain-containing protein [Blautia producta]|uniref:helix-turn-helix domain-containing protein n=1 Tax=Blautia producta TaxID=33035 RepID=UPI003A7F53A0